MNFLQIVQRLAKEAGMSTLGIQTVENQSGRIEFLATLANEAWTDIQQDRHWNFMRKAITIPVVAGTRAYPLADIATDVKEFCKSRDGNTYLAAFWDDNSIGKVWQLERNVFIDRFEQQAFQTATPGYFKIEEGYQFGLNSTPTVGGNLKGYYWKTASNLVNNTDEPNMSEDWHMAIVWSALKSYGEYNDAPEMTARGHKRYGMIYQLMCDAELPDVTFAPSPMGWGDQWR